MPTWLRSIAGLGAGGLNLLANGTNWKQILFSVAVAAVGVVSHITSLSDSNVLKAVSVGAVPNPVVATNVGPRTHN